jgi:hypothetical protein
MCTFAHVSKMFCGENKETKKKLTPNMEFSFFYDVKKFTEQQ